MTAYLQGSADAAGEDTLAAGSMSAEGVDAGDVTTIHLQATMVAASEAPVDDTGGAWAYTGAGVEGAEVVVGQTVSTQSSEQDADGTTSTATSTTELTAYDIQPISEGDVAFADADLASDEPEPAVQPTTLGDDTGVDIDGNIAVVDVHAVAVGDDTLVLTEANSWVVEDQVSSVDGLILLAIE